VIAGPAFRNRNKVQTPLKAKTEHAIANQTNMAGCGGFEKCGTTHPIRNAIDRTSASAKVGR
jgi:hypothetical protein